MLQMHLMGADLCTLTSSGDLSQVHLPVPGSAVTVWHRSANSLRSLQLEEKSKYNVLYTLFAVTTF